MNNHSLIELCEESIHASLLKLKFAKCIKNSYKALEENIDNFWDFYYWDKTLNEFTYSFLDFIISVYSGDDDDIDTAAYEQVLENNNIFYDGILLPCPAQPIFNFNYSVISPYCSMNIIPEDYLEEKLNNIQFKRIFFNLFFHVNKDDTLDINVNSNTLDTVEFVELKILNQEFINFFKQVHYNEDILINILSLFEVSFLSDIIGYSINDNEITIYAIHDYELYFDPYSINFNNITPDIVKLYCLFKILKANKLNQLINSGYNTKTLNS